MRSWRKYDYDVRLLRQVRGSLSLKEGSIVAVQTSSWWEKGAVAVAILS